FVVIGNPTRAYGGSDSDVMPQTQYQVIDVSRQYDFASDFPDNPLNLLTLLNSLAAFTMIHTEYEDVDMYDPANIVWKEGNTTYVFVPTENLPLLEPLRKLGLTDLADALNGPLKEIVERGYDRSYLPGAKEEPAGTSALSVPPASDPAVQAVELKPGPRDADGDDPVTIDTLAAASASDGGDNADIGNHSISGSPETDEGGVDTDEAAATAGGAQHPAAVPTEQAGATLTTRPEKDRTTVSGGPETEDAKTKGRGLNSDSSSSGDKPSDGNGDGD
ncbi:PE-PPE domain-containing protein, partial [Mycobacterium sp. ITM-2017-0098]